MNHQEGDLLQSALVMAARGWHVFPCAVSGKQPALRGNWQHHATTDPARIQAWWTARPYNIGLACGPSGLVVVDLDVPKDPGQTGGAEALAGLCARAGQPLPRATFTVSTPSGGEHLYFTAAGSRVANSAGRLAPLIDIRADGGYVVAPGSHIGDRRYQAYGTTPPAPLPRWLAARLAQPPPPVPRQAPITRTGHGTAYAMAALRDEAVRVATAVDGTRHDTLNRAAFSLGQLVGSGLLPELAVITSLADAARQSGLTREREIHRIIGSAIAAGTRHPRIPRQSTRRQSPGQPRRPGDGPPSRPAPRITPLSPYRTGPATLASHSLTVPGRVAYRVNQAGAVSGRFARALLAALSCVLCGFRACGTAGAQDADSGRPEADLKPTRSAGTAADGSILEVGRRRLASWRRRRSGHLGHLSQDACTGQPPGSAGLPAFQGRLACQVPVAGVGCAGALARRMSFRP